MDEHKKEKKMGRWMGKKLEETKPWRKAEWKDEKGKDNWMDDRWVGGWMEQKKKTWN